MKNNITTDRLIIVEKFLSSIKMHILNGDTFICCQIDGVTRVAVLEDSNNVIIDFVKSLDAKDMPL